MRSLADESLRLLVSSEHEGQRLDVVLAALVPGLSRRAAQALVVQGGVSINGQPSRKSDLVRAGDAIDAKLGTALAWRAPAADSSMPLTMLHEDEWLVAFDKPAGMPSVPHGPQELGTAAGALVARFPECAMVGRRPGDGGLLQRLDTGTSGVMLAARRQQVFDELLSQQEAGRLRKVYVAVTADVALPPVVELPLQGAGRKGRRMRWDVAAGQAARTELTVLERGGGVALVRAVIRGGVRHQIRAHLASCGAPILGDEVYGGANATRLMLHSSEVSFLHPGSGRALTLLAPMPAELSSFFSV